MLGWGDRGVRKYVFFLPNSKYYIGFFLMDTIYGLTMIYGPFMLHLTPTHSHYILLDIHCNPDNDNLCKDPTVFLLSFFLIISARIQLFIHFFGRISKMCGNTCLLVTNTCLCTRKTLWQQYVSSYNEERNTCLVIRKTRKWNYVFSCKEATISEVRYLDCYINRLLLLKEQIRRHEQI